MCSGAAEYTAAMGRGGQGMASAALQQLSHTIWFRLGGKLQQRGGQKCREGVAKTVTVSDYSERVWAVSSESGPPENHIQVFTRVRTTLHGFGNPIGNGSTGFCGTPFTDPSPDVGVKHLTD